MGNKKPPLSGGFSCRELCALDVDCRGALRAILDVKADGVSDLEVVKHDAHQGLRVEKGILRLSIDSDETESTIRHGFDFALHCMYVLLI